MEGEGLKGLSGLSSVLNCELWDSGMFMMLLCRSDSMEAWALSLLQALCMRPFVPHFSVSLASHLSPQNTLHYTGLL